MGQDLDGAASKKGRVRAKVDARETLPGHAESFRWLEWG